jgi:putative transposase
MPRKRHSAEEIINKLRAAEVLLGQGKAVAEVARALGVNETTYPTTAGAPSTAG